MHVASVPVLAIMVVVLAVVVMMVTVVAAVLTGRVSSGMNAQCELFLRVLVEFWLEGNSVLRPGVLKQVRRRKKSHRRGVVHNMYEIKGSNDRRANQLLKKEKPARKKKNMELEKTDLQEPAGKKKKKITVLIEKMTTWKK